MSRLRNQNDQYREEYQKATLENDTKDELLREVKSQLAEEKRKKSFEVEETRKGYGRNFFRKVKLYKKANNDRESRQSKPEWTLRSQN